MTKSKTINIEDKEILIYSKNNEDFISLTDMAHSQLEDVVIIKWLSLKNTIEYIGEWEAMYNPDFNYTEFGTIKWRTKLTIETVKSKKIIVRGSEITIINSEGRDYISITDMLKAKDGDFFISDWLRNRNTVEFLGIWERVYNLDFNYGEYAII